MLSEIAYLTSREKQQRSDLHFALQECFCYDAFGFLGYDLAMEIGMRRTLQEIHSKEMIDQVLAKAQVCRLGLSKDDMPYVVPVSFGYDGEFVYFHTAFEGQKLDYIAANRQVCFEVEDEARVVPNDQACKWSVSYYSVIGFGTVEEILGREGKAYALNQVMRHYSGRDWSFDEGQLDRSRVWRVAIERMTGKQSKDKIVGG